MSVIEVEHLTKNYGSGRGVFDISFKIEKGEVFGFLGPNGSGKSTTIRHLMGFSKPGNGETKILEHPTFNKYYEFLNKVGYIPGEIALPVGLTGWEFIRMMQDLQKIHNQEQLNKMLKMFELDDIVLRGETKRMSLGVKRKLAIVTAFMHDPDILVLDEPTSGLDPVMQGVFIDFLKEEKEKGKTVLLSSHLFSEVDATCDRIAIIKDGRIVSSIVANDFKHNSQKNYYIVFADEMQYANFVNFTKKIKYITVLKQNDDNKSMLISTNDKDINKVISKLKDYSLKEFSNIKETLEDYFMKFYKEDFEYGGDIK